MIHILEGPRPSFAGRGLPALIIVLVLQWIVDIAIDNAEPVPSPQTFGVMGATSSLLLSDRNFQLFCDQGC
jgi:hypothetical protein